MARKRKITKQTPEKRSVLGILRGLGYEVAHPLIVQEVEMRGRRNSDIGDSDIMRMICFGGIPACCLSAKGSGPTVAIAEESAAHAMLDFFRTILSSKTIADILACRDEDSTRQHFQPLHTVFREFERAISADFLSISRVSQYDVSSATILRGREVKKQVALNLSDPQLGYSILNKVTTIRKSSADIENRVRNDWKASDSDDSDVQVLEEHETGNIRNKKWSKNFGVGRGDEVVIVNSSSSMEDVNFSETPKAEVQKMREADVAQKQYAEYFISRQTANRKRKYSREGEVVFGEVNTSRNGPPEVLCAVANVSATCFVETYSSESEEDEIEHKRPRMDSASSIPTNRADSPSVVVHIVNKNTKKRDEAAKESEEEIGEMVDEWDENDDQEPEITDLLGSNETEFEKKSLSGNPQHNGSKPDVSSPLSDFLHRRRLPANFQSRTIGVIYSTREHVISVTDRAIDSVTDISKLTWDHYLNNCQPDAIYDRKMRARQLLFHEIQKLFPDKYVSLQVTGSTVNGCGSYNSDVDMCLCYPVDAIGRSFDDYYSDRSFSSKILRKVDKAFKRLPYKHPFRQLVKFCQLIPAKVPIIKLLLSGEFAGIDIDINVNNIAGIYNSHLIHYYSLSDVRFPALALMVKHWAMNAGVNNSPEGYLNSYTIILLVIHFLQCGVQPAVLPNLQHLFPSKFDKKLPLEEMLLFGDIAEKIPKSPQNTSSLGELLVGFFHYYSHFDFDRRAISVRSAQTFLRNDLPKDTRNYPMFVEEPFDAINTARTVRTSNHMNAIRNAFRDASNVFLKAKFNVHDLGITVVSRS